MHLLARVGARAWLFVGFIFAFGGLIGSLWILVQEFLVPGEDDMLLVRDEKEERKKQARSN